MNYRIKKINITELGNIEAKIQLMSQVFGKQNIINF